MAKDRGYILLHRSIQQSEIWESDEPFTKRDAWIDLLLLAQHAEYKGIKRGDALVSTYWLAKRWKWSRNRVNRYLELLTELGMVTTSGATHGAKRGTTVTIVNYDKYQNLRSTNGATNDTTDGATKRTTKRTTNGANTKNVYTKNVSTNNGDTNTGSAENPPLIDTQYGRIYE